MSEDWRTLKDYPEYLVSSWGRVKSIKFSREKILQQYNDSGYYTVCLYKDDKGKRHKVHVLVANAFVDNPDNKPSIDHINQNKLDNHKDNLRWADFTLQNINKPDRSSHRNISLQKTGSYQVVVKRFKQKICDKTFTCLDEAIAFRDLILSSK